MNHAHARAERDTVKASKLVTIRERLMLAPFLELRRLKVFTTLSGAVLKTRKISEDSHTPAKDWKCKRFDPFLLHSNTSQFHKNGFKTGKNGK